MQAPYLDTLLSTEKRKALPLGRAFENKKLKEDKR